MVARAMAPVVVDGRTVIVVPGARFPADDPVVRAHPEAFERAPAQRSARAK
jgi:hypothetical protein